MCIAANRTATDFTGSSVCYKSDHVQHRKTKGNTKSTTGTRSATRLPWLCLRRLYCTYYMFISATHNSLTNWSSVKGEGSSRWVRVDRLIVSTSPLIVLLWDLLWLKQLNMSLPMLLSRCAFVLCLRIHHYMTQSYRMPFSCIPSLLSPVKQNGST